jgi:asparagine synthase (glutamine-hydrolysing)
MCGIVGYTGADSSIVKKAHALQKHRGPDGSGFFSDTHISLGHNRLAIIDLDERSAQPLWDNAKRYCVVFNGEIFNYQELRNQLSDTYTFVTESDTEVLLALYIRYGTQMCQYLRGMYAFALYDTKTGELFLARDHFGIKPLHYASVNNQFYFASEIRAIASMFGSQHIPLTVSKESVAVYLTLGYTIAPHTIYENINLLEPGTTLFLHIDKPTDITKTAIPLPTPATLPERDYETLIEKKILDSLVADVPVGVFFSGGTDSSLITAVLHDAGRDLETFSVKVSNRDSDQHYFKNIAKILSLRNTTYDFGVSEFDSIYQAVKEKIDNPAASTGFYQTYFLAEKASHAVKVVLLGDGGDELFLGYDRSFPLYAMQDSDLTRGAWLESIYFGLPQFYGKNKLFLKLFQWLKSPLSYYLVTMALLRDRSNPSAWKTCKTYMSKRATHAHELDRIFYLQDGMLLRNDAATSYCSIEGRVPLLDADIFAQSPTAVAKSFQEHMPKYTLKKMLASYVPEEMVYRKKSGFGIDYAGLLQKSRYLQSDLDLAIKDLQSRAISVPTDPTTFAKYPHFALVVTNLWHSLRNNEQCHTAK